MRRSAYILVLAVLAFSLRAQADPSFYSAKEIRGQVVDGASGQPLEGVIVVAQWELVHEVIPGVIHRSEGDTLKIVETMTGKDGRYEIPSWGPIPRPMFYHLENLDPALEFFKPGYYPRHAANEPRSNYNRDAIRASEWGGKVVTLRRFTGAPQEYDERDGRFRRHVKLSGTLEEYASQLSDLQISLHWTKETDDWKQFPRIVLALRGERERLQAAGLNPNYQISRVGELHGGAQAVDRFLEGYRK